MHAVLEQRNTAAVLRLLTERVSQAAQSGRKFFSSTNLMALGYETGDDAAFFVTRVTPPFLSHFSSDTAGVLLDNKRLHGP